jgi:hypothetical protein
MLDNYTLNYHITILPNVVLYSCLTKAKEYIQFKEDLVIPAEYRNQPVDCFFNLYDDKGELVVAAHEQASFLSLKAIINTTPLKMLKGFIEQYSEVRSQYSE